MIKVLLECQIVYPYKRSIDTLVEFCSLWDSCLLEGGTNKLRAKILMPSVHFKKIFGANPRIGEYAVPSGMGYFINSLEVKKLKIE